MRGRVSLCAALLAALLIHANVQTHAATWGPAPRVALIRHDNVLVYQRPTENRVY
jgi:hypothetical protein